MVLTKRVIETPNQNMVQLNNVQGSKQLVVQSCEQITNVSLIEQLTLFFEYSASIFSELLEDVEKSNKRIQELGTRIHNASLAIPSVEQKFELATDVKKKKLFFVYLL